MDRAAASEAEGSGFESRCWHHALVVKWSSRISPKDELRVRFPSGARYGRISTMSEEKEEQGNFKSSSEVKELLMIIGASVLFLVVVILVGM